MPIDPATGHLELGYRRGARFACPHCEAERQPVHATETRQWRHLYFFTVRSLLAGQAAADTFRGS
ncbi:transposase family protein [Thiorhodovibrio frisius]|uniref:transposase family protein n=1 Tax=Thiorhodovibrio frisius TaxID=631362 RepID=UPI00167FC9B5